MKIRIHRGASEIGGSCVEVEASGQRILVDAGLPLNLQGNAAPPLPDVDAALLCAILISHPHLDHFGLVPWLPSVPVAMGAAARRILRAAAPYMKQAPLALNGPDWVNRRSVQIGPFCITPYLVDHSAYDAYALLIEADGKRVFYSGDFRLHGRKQYRMRALMTSPPAGIDTLLLEGTTMGRRGQDSRPSTESDLEVDFQHVFEETTGLALVQASAQNIDRLVTIYRACRKTNRTLVVDLYAAQILEATGNFKIPQSNWDNVALAIPQQQRLQIKRNGWFDALAHHSSRRIYLQWDVAKHPGRYTLLFRDLWIQDLERASCLLGACLIHSQWDGYLKGDRHLEIEAWRHAHGIPFYQIHTSGHACPADLKRIATALAPKTVVPIHTDNPTGYDALGMTVVSHLDGTWWDVGAENSRENALHD